MKDGIKLCESQQLIYNREKLDEDVSLCVCVWMYNITNLKALHTRTPHTHIHTHRERTSYVFIKDPQSNCEKCCLQARHRSVY